MVTIGASFAIRIPKYVIKLTRHYDGNYEPELFPAVVFKRGSVYFRRFREGTILSTGITKDSQMYDCMS